MPANVCERNTEVQFTGTYTLPKNSYLYIEASDFVWVWYVEFVAIRKTRKLLLTAFDAWRHMWRHLWNNLSHFAFSITILFSSTLVNMAAKVY
jgi:hypothetical protein